MYMYLHKKIGLKHPEEDSTRQVDTNLTRTPSTEI